MPCRTDKEGNHPTCPHCQGAKVVEEFRDTPCCFLPRYDLVLPLLLSFDQPFCVNSPERGPYQKLAVQTQKGARCIDAVILFQNVRNTIKLSRVKIRNCQGIKVGLRWGTRYMVRRWCFRQWIQLSGRPFCSKIQSTLSEIVVRLSECLSKSFYALRWQFAFREHLNVNFGDEKAGISREILGWKSRTGGEGCRLRTVSMRRTRHTSGRGLFSLGKLENSVLKLLDTNLGRCLKCLWEG